MPGGLTRVALRKGSLIFVSLFLNNASASSTKSIVPRGLEVAQSNTLLISETASDPKGIT